MKNMVYSGEYSLQQWIKLMLTGNIGLPSYQRTFVWKDADIVRLMKSLQEGQFVQPITIAINKCKDPSNAKNLIIDGQQRLTAILLNLLGVIPDMSKYENSEKAKEEIDDDDDSNAETDSIDWTFEEIIKEYKNSNCPQDLSALSEILLRTGKYIELSEQINYEGMYEASHLSFSYVVPDEVEKANNDEIQMLYTKLFRNINYYGKRLSDMESRRALYYMNVSLKDYFEGVDGENDVLCDISIKSIKDKNGARKIDFIRYLSILSEYYALNRGKRRTARREILKGYSAYSSRESYYADYVSYIVGVPQETKLDKFKRFVFSEVFPNDVWKDRYSELRKSIESVKPFMGLDIKTNTFNSWIDADYWLFGLIYHIVFMGKKLCGDKELLSEDVKSEIAKIKGDKSHAVPPSRDGYRKAPNRLTYIRERLSKSLTIITKYVE